ncbi:hypothetical protein WME94_35400 [Sorangium sp. So ce429]
MSTNHAGDRPVPAACRSRRVPLGERDARATLWNLLRIPLQDAVRLLFTRALLDV